MTSNLVESGLLQRSWHRAWSGIGATGDGSSILSSLIDRYSEPQRHYHTLQHLTECLALFEAAGHLAQKPAVVEVALWFHDAIYEVKGSGNEQKSADWAHDELVSHGVDKSNADEVHSLIMATCHTALPSSPDEKLLVDIDLSILGASEDRFAEYEQQIKDEYSFVPKWIFSTKRKEILRSFLSRDSIYSTEYFKEMLERRARSNLIRAVA